MNEAIKRLNSYGEQNEYCLKFAISTNQSIEFWIDSKKT